MKQIFLSVFLILFLIIPVLAVAPTADFTADPWIGASPLGVNFTDTSTGSPSMWAWYFGDESYLNGWTKINSSAGWTARTGEAITTLPDGSIVIAGGLEDGTSTYLNDVWRSTDGGISWVEMTAAADWTARRYHSLIGLTNGDLLLFGGQNSDLSQVYNDTWTSDDNGATWTQGANADFSARHQQAAASDSSGNVIVTGGRDDNDNLLDDTWMSDDYGSTWTEQSVSAGWGARSVHALAILPNGTAILAGGAGSSGFLNDTWASNDLGQTWVETNAAPPWGERGFLGLAALPNGYLILAGGGTGALYYNDVWLSTDAGATWIQRYPAAWTARYQMGVVSRPNGDVILVGGQDYTISIISDVWKMSTAGSNSPNPYHLFTQSATYPVLLVVHNTDGTDNTSHDVTAGEYLVPHANFNWTQPDIMQPTLVSFHDTTTNYTNQWAWFFGDEPYDQSWYYSGDATSTYGGRTGMAGVRLPNGHLVIMGGMIGFNSTTADVYVSVNNGTTWTLQTSTPGWQARWDANAVALHDGSIVLYGGILTRQNDYMTYYGNTQMAGDTWISYDEGRTWSMQNDGYANAWSYYGGRSGMRSVVVSDEFNDTIIMMGGIGFNQYLDLQKYNDVWISQDKGVTWGLLNANAGWAPRDYFGAALIPTNNNIVIVGGSPWYTTLLNRNRLNDAWLSTNYGVNWTEVNSSVFSDPRDGLSLVGMPDGSIVSVGGDYANWNGTTAGVWRSTDNGTTWNPISSDSNAGSTRSMSVVLPLLDGSIYTVGGQDTTTETLLNDLYSGNNCGAGCDYCHSGADGGDSMSGFDICAYQFSPQGSNDQNPAHTYASAGFYTVSLEASNFQWSSIIQKLLSVGSTYWLNLTFVNATDNATINVVSVTDSTGDSYITTDGTNQTKYFEGSVSISATSSGYQDKSVSFNLENDTTAIIPMIPTQSFSFSQQQNTIWTPPQVVFQVLDNNNNPIVGTPVWANAEFTTMPGGLTGALELFANSFGLSNSTASTILNRSTSYYGTTDSSGSVVFMMVPVISYNVTARDTNGVNYSISIMPKDQYYQIKTLNASFENQAVSEITYLNASKNSIFNTSFYETPNETIGIMGAEIYDSTGHTGGANCWWTLIDNQTTWWSNRTWALGSGLQIINKTVPIVPYQQWQWGCNTL